PGDGKEQVVRSRGGSGGVVLGDHAAQDDATELVHVTERGPQVSAADVLEVDVNAVGAEPAELGRETWHVLVVKGGMNAGFFSQPANLVVRAGAPDNAAAFDLRDLAGGGADRTGGG